MSLTEKKCQPCEGGTRPMTEEEIGMHLTEVDSWSLMGGEITKTFNFKNYYETVSFVNAVAWVAHREDHHPDITFGYKKCRIAYKTHAIGGISENDFICAAKMDILIKT